MKRLCTLLITLSILLTAGCGTPAAKPPAVSSNVPASSAPAAPSQTASPLPQTAASQTAAATPSKSGEKGGFTMQIQTEPGEIAWRSGMPYEDGACVIFRDDGLGALYRFDKATGESEPLYNCDGFFVQGDDLFWVEYTAGGNYVIHRHGLRDGHDVAIKTVPYAVKEICVLQNRVYMVCDDRKDEEAEIIPTDLFVMDMDGKNYRRAAKDACDLCIYRDTLYFGTCEESGSIVQRYNAKTGKVTEVTKELAYDYTIAYDRLIYIGGDENTVRSLDLKSGKTVFYPDRCQACCVAGQYLLYDSPMADPTDTDAKPSVLTVYNLKTGERHEVPSPGCKLTTSNQNLYTIIYASELDRFGIADGKPTLTNISKEG